MRIPGLKTVRQGLWTLRGLFAGGDLILGYHRVARVQDDPWELCLPPEAFREQMETLRRAYLPVPLQQLTDGISPRRGKPRVAISFDDGYADLLEHALPTLEALEMPATIFVVVEGIHGPFWWDRLAGTLQDRSQLPERLELRAGERALRWSRAEGHAALRQALYSLLRGAEPAERMAALAELADWARDAGAQVVEPPAVLDAGQITALAARELVEIGSHGASHAELRDLDATTLQREIDQGREELERLTRRPVESFSYPHGILDDASRLRVAAAGFRRACASSNGLVVSGSDPFRLPRLWPSAMPVGRFRGWLRSWTGR